MNQRIDIDFRSDTVTRPSPAMLQAMMAAEVGDDVFQDDPSVNALEAYAARITGKQAALLCTSGTQSNLVALLAHCQRGDEYIVGQEAHTYKYEGGGAAVLGSIQPQPIEFEADSTLDLEKVRDKIKADDYHFARSRLLCLENTRYGDVLPLDYHDRAASFCEETGLALHLDGARLFNACVKQNVDVAEISQHYDSVSLCISKGLGAPAGSLLVGTEALITEARKWRKMLGGGMRQAGYIAAACQYALENNVQRLAEDHANAQLLARGLSTISGIQCDPASVQTNMVFITLDSAETADRLRAYLAEQGIAVLGGQMMRLVTHLDIDAHGVDKMLASCRRFFSARGPVMLPAGGKPDPSDPLTFPRG
ncbi:low-specificity L-threonine aldolase [Seongchinamella unica]|uniref:Low-specificity L-threonine aldolase n=1 Tax=Seongchinamella unica TaxID=2547392 RepID=A0A4V2ZWV9_9GAMM|nr:low-specificity L-threonine aldolase [Seongchinamella unica]TDG11878.1 low-specificity L-threonine aldolase [Seongchinamella unica]